MCVRLGNLLISRFKVMQLRMKKRRRMIIRTVRNIDETILRRYCIFILEISSVLNAKVRTTIRVNNEYSVLSL